MADPVRKTIQEKCVITETFTNRHGKVSTFDQTMRINTTTSVDSIIAELRKAKKLFGKKYSDLILEAYQDCGCYSDCSCRQSHYVYGKRLETDEEFVARTEQDALWAEEKRQRDLAEFERLKASLGK